MSLDSAGARAPIPLMTTSGLLAIACCLLAATACAETLPLETGAFRVAHELVLPGTPGEIYDAMTGDIGGWWDHSFSEHPFRLEIEARPGGEFREIFDESGDGVRHAVVIVAERGRLLRFEGPLGLSGHALHMVTTWSYEPVGADSTRLSLDVRAAGELEDGWADAVDRTWRHFLFDRLQPYVEGGMKPLRD